MSGLNIRALCNAAGDRIERSRGRETLQTFTGKQEKEGKQSNMRMQ